MRRGTRVRHVLREMLGKLALEDLQLAGLGQLAEGCPETLVCFEVQSFQLRLPERRRMRRAIPYVPCALALHGRFYLVTDGGIVRCLEGESGDELWRWGTWNEGHRERFWRLVPTVVVGDGVALVCAPKRAPVYAVKLGGNGTLKDSDIAWVSSDKSVSSDVSTPLFYKGRFYVLHRDKKSIACIEPASGKVIWSEELDCRGKIEASPTAAEDKIYFISHHGEAFVIATGDEFKLLHKTEMGPGRNGRVRSSIALADGTALVRTDGKLFCLGK